MLRSKIFEAFDLAVYLNFFSFLPQIGVSAYQANTYISVAVQSLFAPILECFNCISRSAGIELICRCVTVYIKNWMDYILEEQILFRYLIFQRHV